MKKSAGQKTIVMFLAAGLLLVLLAAFFVAPVIAKYFAEESADGLYVARSFYLESNMLAEATGTIPQYTLQAGVDAITFDLMNYPDELRFSEVDIVCKVLLEGDSVSYEKTVSFAGGARSKETVVFPGLSAGEYVVTATSTSPYAITLQAKFTVVAADTGLSYQVNDSKGSPFLQVVITTTDYMGPVQITWPEGVVPDNADAALATATGTECTVTVNAHSQYTYRFFKVDPEKEYTEQIQAEKAS